ncbi:MAG: PKD domain-containing protein [Bacteroidetes bacterium]|nr:PKD domain-containing protein [Bacteroidota bacterium]
MKFNIYFVIAVFLMLSVQEGFAQKTARTSSGSVLGPTTHCASYEAELEMRERYPEVGTIEEFEARLAPLVEATKLRMQNGERRAITKIPVVFHVIHNGESVGVGNNLSSTYINAQLEQLNNDYRKITGTSGDNSDPVGADTEIEFCMAIRTPEGTALAEPGINRINRNTAGWTAPPYLICNFDGSVDREYVEGTIKPESIWNSANYFNVWIAPLNCGILGYAQFPSNSLLPGLDPIGGAAGTDGVIVTTSSIGSTTSPNPAGGTYSRGRTLTHEAGHWLGLRHIWGDGDGVCATDYCDDTPESDLENYGCPTTHVSCTTTDMVQNYMDYTNDLCMNIFTVDQKARMQTVLTNSRPGLGTTAVTACDADVLLANFTSEVDSDCSVLEVQFTNTSSNETSTSWNFGDGQSTSDENPNHTYAAPGVYTVVLTVGDGEGTQEASSDVFVAGAVTYNNLNNGTLVNGLSGGDDPWGYVGGHNNYGDIAKAEYFDYLNNGVDLEAAAFIFAAAGGNQSATVKFNIWDNDGPNGFPGTIISTTSLTRGDLNVNGITMVDFPDVTVNGPLYIGFELDYTGTSTTENAISIASNSDGETVPTTAYEQWSDNDWWSFNDGTGEENTWELDVSLAIVAMMDCEGASASNPPVAAFTTDVTAVCEGGTVSFTDESTESPTEWAWTFGDGGTSELQNPTHTYTSDGDYTVTLTATNDDGSDEKDDVTITVNALPEVLLSNLNGSLTASSASSGSYEWYKDNVLINGVSGTTYTATEDGAYKAVLTDGNDCVGTSNTENVVLTAVLDVVLDASISIYPNPVQDKLQLTFHNGDYSDLVLSIVDLSGRTLDQVQIITSQMEIDIRAYNSGVYLFTFETKDGRKAVRKVIKQD